MKQVIKKIYLNFTQTGRNTKRTLIGLSLLLLLPVFLIASKTVTTRNQHASGFTTYCAAKGTCAYPYVDTNHPCDNGNGTICSCGGTSTSTGGSNTSGGSSNNAISAQWQGASCNNGVFSGCKNTGPDCSDYGPGGPGTSSWDACSKACAGYGQPNANACPQSTPPIINSSNSLPVIQGSGGSNNTTNTGWIEFQACVNGMATGCKNTGPDCSDYGPGGLGTSSWDACNKMCNGGCNNANITSAPTNLPGNPVSSGTGSTSNNSSTTTAGCPAGQVAPHMGCNGFTHQCVSYGSCGINSCTNYQDCNAL